MDPTDRFGALVSSGAPFHLDEAALLVAAHAHPGLDVDAQLARLDDLAVRCPTATPAGLSDFLFRVEGFTGNRAAYDDPANSYLDEVLDRRLGIPITLSLLAIEVGRRVGVPLLGVGMPGHFLVREAGVDGDFVDPFAGGVVLDAAGCEARFREVMGPGTPFESRFLDPVPPLAIVARLLANLKALFAARHDRRNLAWVLRLRVSIPGMPLEERRELASALTGIGQFLEAAREFDRLAVRAGEAGNTRLAETARRAARRVRARVN